MVHRKASKTILILHNRNLQVQLNRYVLNKLTPVKIIGIEFNILRISILSLTFQGIQQLTLTLMILSTIRQSELSIHLEASISSIESIV